MAEIMFPLEDTEYGAADAQLWFATRTSGVYANGHLAVSAAGGMDVAVAKGIAWLNYGEFAGAVYGLTATKSLTIPTAHATYPRIDRVVIRYDALTNKGALAILEGTPASTPAAPALTRDENKYEISIAHVYVAAGTTSIAAADITDERLDESVCGLMRDGVTGIDTSVIHAQAISAVEKVQEDAKEILDEIEAAYDAAISDTLAGQLQTQINGKAAKFYKTAAIGTNWAGSGPYTQTVTVTGMLATDTPIIDLLPSADFDTAQEELDAWASIYRIDTGADAITVYADAATTQSITIQILAVR